MAQRSSSPMLNKIRHELTRRRKVINVAKGGVVKKSSAAPPPIPSVSGAGAATLKKSSSPISGAANRDPLPSGDNRADTEYIRKPSSGPVKERSSSILLKKGMAVKVRGPARTLQTGERIVILHPAVVVSGVEDGYLEVAYSGYPTDRTVRIALDQVKNKNMPPTK